MSCNKQNELLNIQYYNIDSPKKLNKTLITSISIDSINIYNNIESSYTGYFFIKKDTIYFADILFNYVFRFDSKGNLIDKNIGKGFSSSKNINGFSNSVVIDRNYYFINERNSEITAFDSEFNRLFEYKIDWQIERSKKEVLNNPDPTKGDTYEFDFGLNDNFKYWDEEHFAIPITTSHPNFNGYYNSKDYYNKSTIIALVNIKSGKVVDLIGRRSPELLKYKNLPNFDHFNYENIHNSIYVNFWCDSIIYEIDKKTKLAIDKFGFSGREMKTDYIETIDYPTAKQRWQIDQKNYGYYNYLKYIKEKELLFRGYKKGEVKKFSGLQIYKNKNLIGDIEVPIGLRIIGVLNDTLMAYNINENEFFELYKINLNYEK